MASPKTKIPSVSLLLLLAAIPAFHLRAAAPPPLAELQVIDGPDVIVPEPPANPDIPEGPSDPNNPLTGQVENHLNAVPDENSTAQQRETAEDQLVALGRNAVTIVRDAASRHTGAKRAVAEVAAFRLQNSIKPKDIIAKWSRKNVDGLRSKQERIAEPSLAEVFPNHLFYVIDFGSKTKMPTGFATRAILAIAADGKVQIVSTDAGLIKFLRSELAAATSAGDRGKIAEVALVLSAGREPGGFPKSEDIVISEDAGLLKAEGATKSAKLNLTLKFDTAGKPLTLTLTREAKKAEPEKATPEKTDPEKSDIPKLETEPAVKESLPEKRMTQ